MQSMLLIAVITAAHLIVGVTSYNQFGKFFETIGEEGSDTPPDGPWPEGIIPYKIIDGFTRAERNNIQLAIDDFHQKTCLRWIPWNGEINYAYFEARNSEGCADADPCFREGRPAIMRFQPTCRDSVAVFVHEMGHVICLNHEEQRLDRDSYIHFTNESLCKADNIYQEDHMYDYLAVMHYPCGLNCSIPVLPGVTTCGQIWNPQFQDGRLSVLDAEKINDLYNCGGCKSYRFRFPNQTTPQVAFPSGHHSNGTTFYTCRAYVDGNILVGRITNTTSVSFEYCHLPDGNGGEVYVSSGFEILTNPRNIDLLWVRASGSIPYGSVAGGRSKINESVYIGRCRITMNGNEFVIPGSVMANTPQQMRISFQGQEYVCDDFEILTCL